MAENIIPSEKSFNDGNDGRGKVKYIRTQWIDFSGVLRARFLPLDRCDLVAEGSDNICMSQNSMLLPVSTSPRSFTISDYHETWFLQPDWTSMQRCGFKPDHASVMSFVKQKKPAEQENPVEQEKSVEQEDPTFDKCPRTCLNKALAKLNKDYGAKVTMGFEIEFVLLDKSDKLIQPLDRLNGYCRPAGLRGNTMDLMDEILTALERSSIKIHHFHAEAYDQLEIALAAQPAMKAIDSLVLAQETIRSVCIRHQLKATMTPKPTFTGPFNGLHLHLSLDNLTHGSVDNFLAGILQHMHSLCAFGMANYDSYVRSVNDAAGEWIGFGTDNRDFPIREISLTQKPSETRKPSEIRWELRMLDATANPYLFAAAVLFAGLDGLKKSTQLVWKDCQYFPADLDEKRREEHGLMTEMPGSLKEALDDLRGNKSLKHKDAMGEELVKWYLHVKDKEVKEFGKMTEEERRWKFLEYF